MSNVSDKMNGPDDVRIQEVDNKIDKYMNDFNIRLNSSDNCQVIYKKLELVTNDKTLGNYQEKDGKYLMKKYNRNKFCTLIENVMFKIFKRVYNGLNWVVKMFKKQ